MPRRINRMRLGLTAGAGVVVHRVQSSPRPLRIQRSVPLMRWAIVRQEPRPQPRPATTGSDRTRGYGGRHDGGHSRHRPDELRRERLEGGSLGAARRGAPGRWSSEQSSCRRESGHPARPSLLSRLLPASPRSCWGRGRSFRASPPMTRRRNVLSPSRSSRCCPSQARSASRSTARPGASSSPWEPAGARTLCSTPWAWRPRTRPTRHGSSNRTRRRPESAAVFEGTEMIVPLSVAVRPGAVVAITIEHSGGASAPTQTPKLVAQPSL